MTRRWNTPHEVEMHAMQHGHEDMNYTADRSDRDVVLTPQMVRKEHVLRAMARVVAELVEIEEARASERPAWKNHSWG